MCLRLGSGGEQRPVPREDLRDVVVEGLPVLPAVITSQRNSTRGAATASAVATVRKSAALEAAPCGPFVPMARTAFGSETVFFTKVPVSLHVTAYVYVFHVLVFVYSEY